MEDAVRAANKDAEAALSHDRVVERERDFQAFVSVAQRTCVRLTALCISLLLVAAGILAGANYFVKTSRQDEESSFLHVFTADASLAVQLMQRLSLAQALAAVCAVDAAAAALLVFYVSASCQLHVVLWLPLESKLC